MRRKYNNSFHKINNPVRNISNINIPGLSWNADAANLPEGEPRLFRPMYLAGGFAKLINVENRPLVEICLNAINLEFF